MQKVIIQAVVQPTIEVFAKVMADPNIKIVPESDLFSIISAIGSLLLGVSVLFTGGGWFWEHIIRNYFGRYKLDIGHNIHWIKENIYNIVTRFESQNMFSYGSLYCFKIINRGTTHDYIYKAELDNRKGMIIDISADCILKGTPFVKENLPHVLQSLQGEVWFVAAQNENFINISNPEIIIYSAMRTYRLKLGKEMFVVSKKRG